MKNKEFTNALTRHIRLIPEVADDIKNDENIFKKYLDERYEYIRNGRYAGNKGFNLVLSATSRAKYLGQSQDEIGEIFYSYSHSGNDVVSGFSVDKLKYLKQLAPITEEVIQNELKKYKSAIKRNKKNDGDELTKTDKKKIEAEEKKLRKFLDATEEDIQFEINKKQQYNKFPEDLNDKWMNGCKQPQRIVKRVEDFWKSSLGDDVLAGRSSLPIRRLDAPIILPKDLFYDSNKKTFTGLYHNYGDLTKKILTDKNPEVFLKLPYKKDAPPMVFKMDLGYKPNNVVRDFIYKIFIGEIEIMDCQMNFTENKKTHKDTDLTLFLTGEILKKKEHNLDYDKVMGIDLGWNNPVSWAVNYDTFTHDFLGDIEYKNKKLAKIDKEINDLRKSVADHAKGGHGYKRKCEALLKAKSYKRNFNKTFNDRLSSKVIQTCIKLGIGTIKMEDLSDIGKKINGKGISKDDDEFKNKIMANWCYYELQQMIQYKAALNGIEVYYINPAYTSQTCAFCGQRGIRGVFDKNGKMIDSSKFFCIHDLCESHKINWKNGAINADRNAAMVIAKSEDYVGSRNEGLWRRNVGKDINKNIA